MANLDNLLSEIISDSEQKARHIIASAEEQATAITSKKKAEAEQARATALPEMEAEAERQAQALLSEKRLELRDKLIYARREVIQRVLDDALQELKDMPEADFRSFIVKRTAEDMKAGEAEIILPKQYQDMELDSINVELRALGKDITLKRHSGGRYTDGGFILVAGGVEINETFAALLNYYRDELEAQIMSLLF